MMKKTMIAAVAVLAMSGAMAAGEYVTFGASRTENTVSGVKSIDGSVAVGTSLEGYLSGLTGELRALATRDQAAQVGNAVEARATYALPTVWGAKTWVRGTLGEAFGTGYNYGYWAVEPGFTYAFTPAFSAEASVKRELTFDRGLAADSTVYTAGVNYALTKNNIVSGKAYRTQAGTNFSTGYTAELTHTF
jgi:hypothetical protein